MSFPRYAKYKDSGVEWLGEVPEHWESCRNKVVFTEIDERYDDEDGKLLTVSHITGVTLRSEKDVTMFLADTFIGYKRCRIGDLVINTMWAWMGALGCSPCDGIVSPSYNVYRPRKPRVILPRFYDYLCRIPSHRTVMKAKSTGVWESRLRLYPEAFLSMSLTLPPFHEQILITAFLDRETAKINELVGEQRRLIELLKEKRQAIISHAVTKGLNPHAPMKPSGIEWLGDVPEHWPVLPVNSRYRVELGKMLDSTRITGEHLRPYLRVVDVQWGAINTDDLPVMDFDAESRKRYRLVYGDLLVNEGGSYPGRSAIWLDDIDECYYQKALHRMRQRLPEDDSCWFFYYVMCWATNQGVFVAGGNESTIEHLPAEKLRRYRFAFPPMAEQLSIVDFLARETADLDALTAEAQRAIDLLQERRTALISAAVTGKIDVRGLVESEAA